jgi:hypothetical protein
MSTRRVPLLLLVLLVLEGPGADGGWCCTTRTMPKLS